jgi:hypothetical protein
MFAVKQGLDFLFPIVLIEAGVTRFSDQATGWTVRGLNPARGKSFFSSPKRPDGLWGPLSVVFIGLLSPGVKTDGSLS